MNIFGVDLALPITKEERKTDLSTGKYIPQNHTSTPMDLKNFPAASTSLEKNE